MKNFEQIEGVDMWLVDRACRQIEEHPELWDRHTERTLSPESPHAQSSDIWLRFRPEHELDAPQKYGEPHFAEFYPAWSVLTELHNIVFDAMARQRAVYLGGILLTRISPGAKILPHADIGWHPEFMNAKAYVILKANEHCFNYCGDETVVMRPGEVWLFNNLIPHSVENNGGDERIALIITMRIE